MMVHRSHPLAETRVFSNGPGDESLGHADGGFQSPTSGQLRRDGG